ncbi:hypothetical protein [Streptomyces sp. NPDC006551]|uniref:hypothetical protein n=1 Tax=Streptomyces sp. NPDC006551 TaxID=3157178 RepID=UPI0033AD1141
MDVGAKLTELDRRLKAIERASRLSSASLDDTALEVRDTTGSLRALVGQQADGTTAVNVVNGPTPPAPSPPYVASVLGGVAAAWDGAFADGAVLPLDFSRVEVHASSTSGFTPTAATLQNTIETPQGAVVTIPTETPLYVRLVTRNTSGTASTASAQNGPIAPALIVADDVADGIITGSKLAADAIDGKIITGATVQTAAAGRRIRLAPDGRIYLYSGATTETAPAEIWGDVLDFGGGQFSGMLKIKAPRHAEFEPAEIDMYVDETGQQRWVIGPILAYNDPVDGPGTIVSGPVFTDGLSCDTLSVASTTWDAYTPVVTGAGTPTYTTRTGWYRQIGDEVYFCAYIVIGATAGTGSALITVTAPTLIDRTTRQIVPANGDGMSGNSGSLQAVALPGTVTNVFDRIRNSTGTNVTGSALVTGATLTIQGSYRRAA